MDKQKTKKRNRKTVLGIKLPPIDNENIGNVQTIIDVDPHFYSLVEGRPIRPNKSLLKYKQDIREVALKRTLHGFLVDEILRINREIETERKKYETASTHFDEYKHSFDKFLAFDNNKTIVIMKTSDSLAKELANQTEDNKKASYELASLKSKLQYIDETLQILLSFQSFLYNAAPVLWREKVSKPVKYSEIFTMDTNFFIKIDINLIKERLSKLHQPCLYFETPEQLINAFSMLEKQNLNYLLVTEELNSEKRKFLKSVEHLKCLMNVELDYVQQQINLTEEIIKWNEAREVELKKVFFNILNENMRYLISSETALQIFNYVEFAFNQIIAPNDTKLSPLEMMFCLEREYNNIMLDLSAFDLDDIKSIEKEIYEKGVNEIKQAKIANKLLKDIDKLSKRLKSAYEPSKRTYN
ncbi:unnamed protein product [Colias eurytheme]|nr:unnamed protein product [Colias eurytheme]